MYPDCYGIDMSQLGRFIAFEAAVSLLRDRGEEELLLEVEEKCREQVDFEPRAMRNHVAMIYDRFTLEEISDRVASLIRSDRLEWDGEIEMVYQDIEGLREAMPGHTGDWYFTGDFPTPGGHRVVNKAFVYYMEGNNDRAY